MEPERHGLYDPETRLKAVEMYLEDGSSPASVVERFGLSSVYTLIAWLDRYRRLGAEGLADPQARSHYSTETKLAAVRMHIEEGQTLIATLDHFGIRTETSSRSGAHSTVRTVLRHSNPNRRADGRSRRPPKASRRPSTRGAGGWRSRTPT